MAWWWQSTVALLEGSEVGLEGKSSVAGGEEKQNLHSECSLFCLTTVKGTHKYMSGVFLLSPFPFFPSTSTTLPHCQPNQSLHKKHSGHL